MAFDVEITGLSSKGAPRWQIEAPWWPIDDLNAVLEFNDVSKDPSYRDYVAKIDVGAAKVLAEKYASLATDHWQDRVKDLADKLKNRDGRVDRVEIKLAEWDSGR